MAQKIGIPIEELSRLKYVADLSGVSMQTLATGVRKLSVNMTDALAKPTSEVAAAFQKLGIELTNADGSMRSSQDILVQLSDKFAAMPDAAEKNGAGDEAAWQIRRRNDSAAEWRLGGLEPDDGRGRFLRAGFLEGNGRKCRGLQ
nr:phage tail tape measure protein [Sinorhizobium meliloti]